MKTNNFSIFELILKSISLCLLIRKFSVDDVSYII